MEVYSIHQEGTFAANISSTEYTAAVGQRQVFCRNTFCCEMRTILGLSKYFAAKNRTHRPTLSSAESSDKTYLIRPIN